MMKSLSLLNIWRIIFPHYCVLCNTKSDQGLDICTACQNDLPFINKACKYCGIKLHNDQFICGKCLQKLPPFNSTFALCDYDFPIDKLILDLKFRHQLVNAKILGELMAQRLLTYVPHFYKNHKRETWPEFIIPVPLSKKRLRERGFNQAVEIAKPISKRLKIPICFNGCKRIRNTDAQSSIAAGLRQQNVKNAFVIEAKFNAKHVALVDDVMTTGHTVAELSRVLQGAGVEIIEIWCCTRR